MEKNNFAFFFGCRTNENVKSDTKMIKDVADALLSEYDTNYDFSVEFPKVFESLAGSDANFEAITSSTL